MPEEIGLFEAISTMRAMRRLRPDPVPDELIHQIIAAGTCAPSGGDRQPWRFIVVRNPQVKKQLQVVYKKGLELILREQAAHPPAGKSSEQNARRHAAVEYLTEHLHEAPVLIVCCLLQDPDNSVHPKKMFGASIYPAVQNILLAARGMGLGATLTTRHLMFESEVNEILALPANAETYAMIPIGYPMGRFGPLSRLPVEQVTFRDRWGTPYR